MSTFESRLVEINFNFHANSQATGSMKLISNHNVAGAPASHKDVTASQFIKTSSDTFLIESNCLRDIFQYINDNHSPATYDLQGKVINCLEEENLTLTASGVTLKNGTICLTPSMSLFLEGTDATFERIMFTGGAQVEFRNGARATMNSCHICSMTSGIVLHGNSFLYVNSVSVYTCRAQGILLHDGCCLKGKMICVSNCTDSAALLLGNSSLMVKSLTVTNCRRHGIIVTGSSTLAIKDTQVSHCGRSAIQLQDNSCAVALNVQLHDCLEYGVTMYGTSNLSVDGMSVCACAESAFHLYDRSNLEASNLKMTGLTGSGVIMRRSSSITITDCEVDGARSDGICMHENSRLVGTRVILGGIQQRAMRLCGKSSASLISCTIRGKSRCAGVLEDEASMALSSCLVGLGFLKKGTSKVIINHDAVMPANYESYARFCCYRLSPSTG